MGRFLTRKDMFYLKRKMEIFNSRLKRGEIKDPQNIQSIRHIVCGCGVQGCCFIHAWRREQ